MFVEAGGLCISTSGLLSNVFPRNILYLSLVGNVMYCHRVLNGTRCWNLPRAHNSEFGLRYSCSGLVNDFT